MEFFIVTLLAVCLRRVFGRSKAAAALCSAQPAQCSSVECAKRQQQSPFLSAHLSLSDPVSVPLSMSTLTYSMFYNGPD